MIFLHAYHGTVDETVATLDADGRVVRVRATSARRSTRR